ncbi:MAG: hypothetical protein Q9M75_08585 [Ghiorsea sp.]|nr:hypothetical protein [Ghiorsea sp.]
MSSSPAPIERTRNSDFPYKFKLTKDYTQQTSWKLDQPFIAEWLEINKDGLVTVKTNKSGFAWDGCTPKWSIFHLFIIGTPDGHINYRTMKPYTYHASLVHDALYQYLDTIPISKVDVDLLFRDMLGNFFFRGFYHFMVKHFGGKGIVQKGVHHE